MIASTARWNVNATTHTNPAIVSTCANFGLKNSVKATKRPDDKSITEVRANEQKIR